MQASKRVRILTFHGLGTPTRTLPAGEDNYWLDAGFYGEILDRVVGRPDVAITFDDSNLSDYEIAVPALVARRLKATFFVVSERIDQPGFLTRGQIDDMVRAGMGIGSHGTQHRPWATLAAKDLHEELNASRATLEDLLGSPVREAACPYGSYNRRVLNALRAAGYQRVYTSDKGQARTDEWLSARNTIMRTHTIPAVEHILHSSVTGIPALLRSLKLTIKRYR